MGKQTQTPNLHWFPARRHHPIQHEYLIPHNSVAVGTIQKCITQSPPTSVPFWWERSHLRSTNDFSFKKVREGRVGRGGRSTAIVGNYVSRGWRRVIGNRQLLLKPASRWIWLCFILHQRDDASHPRKQPECLTLPSSKYFFSSPSAFQVNGNSQGKRCTGMILIWAGTSAYCIRIPIHVLIYISIKFLLNSGKFGSELLILVANNYCRDSNCTFSKGMRHAFEVMRKKGTPVLYICFQLSNGIIRFDQFESHYQAQACHWAALWDDQ